MTFTVRLFSIFYIISTILLALIGCDGEPPKQPEPEKKAGPMIVVLVAPETGPLAPVGESMVRGAEMAMADFEKKHPNMERPIKLRVRDEASSNFTPGILAVDGHSPVVVGHAMEKTLEKARPSYIKSKTPVLLPLLSSSRTSEIGDGWFYRMLASDEEQGRAMGLFAHDTLNAKKVLVLYVDEHYSRLAARSFTAALTEKGGVEVEEVMMPDESGEMTALAKKTAENKPDAIFLSLHAAEAVFAAQAFNKAEVESVFLGTHVLGLAETAAYLGEYSKKSYISLPFNPYEPRDEATIFIAEFEKYHHRAVDWTCVVTYDAVSLAAETLAKVGDEPEKLQAAFNAINSPEIAYSGLAGAYYFKPGGHGVGPVYPVPADNRLLGRIPETGH